MAKVRKKRSAQSVAAPPATEPDDAIAAPPGVKLEVELTPEIKDKLIALGRTLREQRAKASAERAKYEEASRAISRAIAIRDNLIPPPWYKLPKPKKKRRRNQPKLTHIKKELPKLYPPRGRVPDSVSVETVRQRLKAECNVDASWDSTARALRRRKD